jgi:hypothetical protein
MFPATSEVAMYTESLVSAVRTTVTEPGSSMLASPGRPIVAT